MNLSARQYRMQIAYCILSLLAVWGYPLAMLSHDYDQAIKNIEQNNDQLTRAFEEHVRRSLHAVEDQMLLIKDEYEQRGVTPAILGSFQRARTNPLLIQISILDSAGNTVAATIPVTPGMNFSDRSYFQEHIAVDSKQTYISEPLVGRNSTQTAILMSRRLNGPNGNFSGVVMMARCCAVI